MPYAENRLSRNPDREFSSYHEESASYEYQYKAEYDYALVQNGVLEAGFPSIISAGKNNFCIHYDSYRGQAQDGDIVLNDVGARWDHELTDVSRGWLCNGKYTEKQKLLFECGFDVHDVVAAKGAVLQPGMVSAWT